MHTEVYHKTLSVDNSSVKGYTRHTREQKRIGGIRSGATRRFKARNCHARIRTLHRDGLSQVAIAREVGYSQPTVSRVLRGVIRTCLTLAETISKTVAYPARGGYTRSNPGAKGA